MKILLHNTSKLVWLNGVPARIWEGYTASGIAVHAYITRLAVEKKADAAEFESELQECAEPSADIQNLPLHLLI